MIKATRKLSDINFEKEGSAVALVGPHQGGPANGWKTLITKSTDGITQEQVEKATMVQVELTIVEFLRKFFDMWYDDAEVLARIMGFDTSVEENDRDDDWYENYINEKVEAVTIMKSLVLDKNEEEINKAVASLKPEELLTILSTQKKFEQNLSSQEGVKLSKGKLSPSVENSNKGTEMSDFVTKSVHEAKVTEAVEAAVAKALEEKETVVAAKQAELDAALAIVKSFEDKEKESVAKSRKEALKQAGVAEEEVESLYKSCEALDTNAFEIVVKAMAAKSKAIDESDIMKETGVSGESVAVELDGVAALTKSLQEKYTK